MYTITRGPSKLTTQRRTGPKQQIDSKLQELKGKQQQQQLVIPTLSDGWDPLPSPSTPKLVFNRVNGKRSTSLSPTSEEEVYTPAHEENVRFVYQAWQEVQHQLEKPELNGCRPQQYQDQTPNPTLKSYIHMESLQQKICTLLVQNLPPHLKRWNLHHKSAADFVPIDLEDWWAERFLANIENCA